MTAKDAVKCAAFAPADCWEYPVRAQIAALPHKTLVVHGRDDRIIPLDNALHLLRTVPDVRLHVFGRCGHWTQIEHADAFNRLVLDFLTS